MKNLLITIMLLTFTLSMTAQTIAIDGNGVGTITITAAGQLKTAIDALVDKTEVKALVPISTLTGSNALNADDVTALQTLTSLDSLNLSEFTGAPVDIPASLLHRNQSVTKFVFPPATRNIGGNAFVACALQGELNLPASVNGAANLQSGRFGNSLGITAINVDPQSTTITTIDGVVYNKAVSELHFYPAGKTDRTYLMPNTVEKLMNDPIDFNPHLQSITYGSALTTTSAGDNRFDQFGAQMPAIDSLFVAEDNSRFGSVNGLLYELTGNRLVLAPRARTEVRIIAPIQKIAGGGSQNAIFGGNGNTGAAFFLDNQAVSNNYTKFVTLVDIPATVTEIENGAFVGGEKLATIISRATLVPVNGKDTWRNIGGGLIPAWSTKVYVPAAALDDYKTSTWIPGDGYSGFPLAAFFAFYNINITAGAASSPLAADIAAEGQTVSIIATEATAGQVFKNWTSTGDVLTFADATSAETTFTMPAGDVSITANYVTLHSYTVVDGITPSGEAIAGTVINIEAAETKGEQNNEIFQYWEVVTGENVLIDDVNAASTSFTMIDSPVTIQAVYNTIYNISVIGGTASLEEAYEGDEVIITATVPENYSFIHWTSSPEDVIFADQTSETTTFSMPANSVEITANFDIETALKENIETPAIRIYPNPATNYIRLSDIENTVYVIYNSLGKTILQGIVQNEAISIVNLSKGLYILKIEGQAIRFIKQ
jgi:hypothetical protein